jgi:hypothetical protein
MSLDNVKGFFEKVEADKSLHEKLKALDEISKDSMETAIDELVELAKTEGFVFTPQQFAEAKNEQLKTDGTVDLHLQTERAAGPGIGCQPGMGLYIHVEVPPKPEPPPDPPQNPDPGCVSLTKLKCGGHGLQGLR